MELAERYDLTSIRDESRELVYRRIGALLEEQTEMCRCETCVLDLVAYVLNRVTPRYTTSLLGSLRPGGAIERRVEVEIDLALQAGLKRLREHPHHA